MNTSVRLPLNATPAQVLQLTALQAEFARACNALAPTVARHRCWNRVALHHLAYKELREAFPSLGSQMACNAIYAVCRASRVVYQHPKSPFNVNRLGNKPLPRLQFGPQSPVFYDRHTMSLRHGQASVFTLDGRVMFNIDMTAELSQRFRDERVREIVLNALAEQFALNFIFESRDHPQAARRRSPSAMTEDEMPAHVQVHPSVEGALPLPVVATATPPSA